MEVYQTMVPLQLRSVQTLVPPQLRSIPNPGATTTT